MTETATSPVHLMQMFAQRAASGDLDSLMELYEENAVFQPQDGVVLEGKAQISEALAGMMSLNPQIEFLGETEVLIVGDIALVKNDWKMTGTAPDGSAAGDSGISADVVRRQADGSWLVMIDQPRGAPQA